MTRGLARTACVGALLAAAPLSAQTSASQLPDSGTRVRIRLEDRRRVVGTLVGRDPDRWLVVQARRDTLAIVPPQVDRLDVSHGLRSPARAFWRGAGIGAIVGGSAAVAAVGLSAATGGASCADCLVKPVFVVAVAGTALTVAATLVGGILGSHARERWRRVPLPVQARVGTIVTPHAAGVGARITLR